MKIIEQDIKGVWIIEGEPSRDERGAFRRHFCVNEFKKNGLDSRVAQANLSENFKKFTLRGFHYQIYPFEESKTISCIMGSIYDVVVDLRPKSKSLLKWAAFELESDKNQSLHVPAGCANAYLTLTDKTLIHYYMSEFYNPESCRGVRYNDPFFKFIWPAKPLIISEKDRNYPDFNIELLL